MRKIIFIKRLLITLMVSLLASTQAFAAPAISNISGLLANGATITVNGTGFGANGPTIVVFDDFEGGTNGSNIKTGAGSATIGKWDRIGGGDNNNPPKYDNAYKVSGNMALKGDYTIQTNSGSDSSSAAFVDNINTGDVFMSFWFYLPTTSNFPCFNGGTCNWKLAWLYGTNANDDDLQIPDGLPDTTTEPFSSWNISCNDCYGGTEQWYTLNMYKGKWYRKWIWVHATADNASQKDLWVMSTDASIPVTKKVSWTGRIFNASGDQFEHFVINPWARLCNNCSESKGRFDDVYVATGPYARARVEIGNSATYSNSTNLAIATVTSWSDSSITATLRQGSYANFNGAYLYVIDANGNVNANGYPLCPRCPMPPTLK